MGRHRSDYTVGTIQHFVPLKPEKSLGSGGWGGCEPCSLLLPRWSRQTHFHELRRYAGVTTPSNGGRWLHWLSCD